MANKPTQPLFPLGIETAEQSKLKGFLNTDIIEHGPDAIMTVPETKAADGLPSAVRYNSESDDFEGFYEHGGWLPLGGGGVRWEVLPHAPTATLESGRGYLINNTSGASTVVLPLPTRIGDSVTVCDMYGKFSVYPLTIDPNGNAMYGNVEAMTISTDSATATFTWTGDARGWIITAGVGLGQGRVYSRTIYTDTLGFPTSEVTLTTQPSIVDVYVDGKRLVESKYSLSGYEVRFSPSLPAGVELQVVQYVPIQLGLGSGGSDSGITPWVYNGGAAVGGETTISVPDLALGVPFITINGYANYPGFAYSYDAGAHVLTFGTPLEVGDMVVLMLSGEVAGNIPVNTSAGFLAIEALRRTYADAGYNLVEGSFGRGGTVTTATDVLLNEVDGKAYSWGGTLPKTVPLNSTPETTGGVGVNSWSDMSETYDILITYGQSNSVGFAAGQTGTPSTLEGRGVITPLGYYWNGSAVVPLIYDMVQSSGEKSTGNAWVPFANEYCKLTGRKLIVIPCAKGATTIAQLQKGGQWYTAMTAYVSNCLAWLQSNNKFVGKRWMGFHQGETDQLNLTPEADYVTGLVQLKNDVVADFTLNKFVIHFVGYPQNRKETSWDSIINIQRRLVRSHKDVVCGFDACDSFTMQNGMLTSDRVHYAQIGFNLMGSTSGRVVADLVLNDETNDYRGDSAFTQLKFPKDRWWFMLSASVEKLGGVWSIKDRANSVSGIFSAVSNIDSIAVTANSELRLHTAADISSMLQPLRVNTTLALEELGFRFIAEAADSRNVAIHCIANLSFLVKTDGTIASHTGNALNPLLSQLISASYNSSTQNWTVTVAGNMVGSATVAPYGVGSNARLVGGTGAALYVNCPSADANKSFSVQLLNTRINFTDFDNIGPIHLSGIGGQPNW